MVKIILNNGAVFECNRVNLEKTINSQRSIPLGWWIEEGYVWADGEDEPVTFAEIISL